jgi:hypothetical protein
MGEPLTKEDLEGAMTIWGGVKGASVAAGVRGHLPMHMLHGVLTQRVLPRAPTARASPPCTSAARQGEGRTVG